MVELMLILITAIAFLLIVIATPNLLLGLVILLRQQPSYLILLSCLIVLLYIAGLVLLLKFRRPLAMRLAGPQPFEIAPDKSWIPVGFRFIAFAAGLFGLYKALASAINIIAVISLYRQPEMTAPLHFEYSRLIFNVLITAASIYLLTGAKHLVNWQTKKTLAIMENIR